MNIKGLLKVTTISLAAGTAIAATVTPASASSLSYATTVEQYNAGSGVIGDRGNTDNALGAPQADDTNNFLSLGMEGDAIFSFGGLFNGSVTVWETTWGHKSQQSDYDEQIEVFVGNNIDEVENWLRIGEILNIQDGAYDGDQNDGEVNSGATLDIGNDESYKYVRVVDTSNQSGDGFDVNAIGVNPVEPGEASASVPEPGSMFALAAVGGLLAATRRHQNS
jgi:hypothetical protein